MASQDCDQEEWRWIPGFEGLYEISNLGRLRSYYEWRGRPTPSILRTAKGDTGYPIANLRRNSIRSTLHVHKLVALVFLGEPDADRTFVNHKDLNRANNHISNLEYVSHQENVDHAHDLAQYRKGSAVYGSKLTEEKVLQIRALAGTITQREIAKLFGIGQQTVSEIVRREIWRHLSDEAA